MKDLYCQDMTDTALPASVSEDFKSHASYLDTRKALLRLMNRLSELNFARIITDVLGIFSSGSKFLASSILTEIVNSQVVNVRKVTIISPASCMVCYTYRIC